MILKLIRFIKRLLYHVLIKIGCNLRTVGVEQGGKIKLDAEYRVGRWDYLAGIEELSRFSIIVGYCHFYKEMPDILEIGCGEGLLKERLCSGKYKSYTGIDISEIAIKKALKYKDDKSEFIAEDAVLYSPLKKFDIIIFNECLIYLDDVGSLITKNKANLKNDGIIIISIFDEEYRSKKIWNLIDPILRFQTGSITTNYQNFRWIIRVYK